MPLSYRYLSVGPFGATCAIIRGGQGDAWLVDPGGEAGRIVEALGEERAVLRRILLTHGHADHVAALDAVLDEYPGTPVTMHREDAEWAFTSANVLPPFYAAAPRRPARLELCGEGDRLAEHGLAASVLHLPGHTPGSVGYLFDDGTLFCGDTLFAGSVGRTDLPGGDARVLSRSLRRLAALPPDTEVVPGHGHATTIGEERRANPFLAPLETGWKGS